MTLDRCVALLKELQALERIALAIASRGLDADWEHALLVLGDRCYWVRAALQHEDPMLVKQASDVLRAEVLSSSTRDTPAASRVKTASTTTIH